MMMKHYICDTCGVQYPLSAEAPDLCTICNEERQYINPHGQSWTTLEEMRESKRYTNDIIKEEEHLYSIRTNPSFGINQTAYLVQDAHFHLLWDCITYFDDAVLHEVKQLGGIDAIALSHPHYYSAQVEWAETLNVPIYIHEDDQEWVVRDGAKKSCSGRENGCSCRTTSCCIG
jgi:hypothetical protein